MANQGCAIRFLDDLPADEDAFGSHEPIVDAIGDFIEQEEGGKAIALTGSFGSGKSTVVKLLQKRFGGPKSAADVQLFVYDAWAHQGDPLRRSFLETFRDFLLAEGSIKEGEFEQKFDEITRRRQETTAETRSTTTPVLTLAGKFMILALFLVPAAIGLIERVDPNHPWTLRAGLAVVAAPLLVALATWLWWRPSLRFWTKFFWVENRRPHADDSAVELFWSRTRESKREEHQSSTSVTPEPTSIEFGELFQALLDKSLRDERRMVIVVDNLDRLDSIEAQQVWSTMRVFFEPGGHRPLWANKLWLIVPFDPEGIGRVWASSHAARDTKKLSEEDGAEVPQPLASQVVQTGWASSRRAEAAIDKTFQISFRVPEPVLSDWQKYFAQQLTYALPDHAEGEFLRIYLIFSHLRQVDGRPVTPREIKLFVNKLAANHKVSGHAIPLPSQAAYVLSSNRIANAFEDLIKPDFLDTRVQALLDDQNWRLHLAALHFDVPIAKAGQVLMGETVRRCLVNADAATIDELAPTPGFREVCENVIHDDLLKWAALEPRSIAFAALALERAVAYEATWSYLRYAATLVNTHSLPHVRWWPLDERVGSGLCAILRRCPQEDREAFAGSVLQGISESQPQENNQLGRPTTANELPEQQIEDWIRGASKVLDTVIELSGSARVSQAFRVPGTPHAYLRFIGAATRLVKPEMLHYFVAAISPDEIVAEIASRIEQGKLEEGAPNTVEALTQIQRNCAWKPVADAITKKLNDTGALNAGAIAAWLDLLLPLAMTGASSDANDWLRNAARGIMLHHLQNVRSDQDAAARCCFVIVLFNPACEVASVGQSPQGAQTYQELLNNPDAILHSLLQLVIKWSRFTAMLETVSRQPALKRLVQAISREMVGRNDIESFLDDSALLSHYVFLSEALGPEATSRLVQRYAARESFILKVAQTQFAEGLATLYQYMLKGDGVVASQQSTRFREFLRKGLQSVAKAAWQKELLGFGPILQLAVAMARSHYEPNLGSAFQDAMIEHARTLIGGQNMPDGLAWRDLMAVLPREKRALFIRDLRDLLVRSGDKPLSHVLNFYGEPLTMCGSFADKSDDTVRNLFRPIVTRRAPDELKWMEQVLRKEPDIATKSQTDATADLLERVKSLEADTDISDDIRLLAGRLAAMLSSKP